MTQGRGAEFRSDPYDINSLTRALSDLGYGLEYLPETASTMDDARKFGTKPMVVLTNHQNRGRGRIGRSWLDQPGMSVLMTVVEPFNEIDGDPEGDSYLTQQFFVLAADIALQKVTENPGILIKWPNDIVFERRKVGGILIENPDYSAIATYPKLFGIGLNIHYPLADETFPNTDYGAISLSEIPHGKNRISRQDVVIKIMEEWSKARPHLRGVSHQPIWQKYDGLWRQNATALTGRRVRIIGINRTPDESIEGVVTDFPLGKALILTTRNGQQEFREFSSFTKVEVIN